MKIVHITENYIEGWGYQENLLPLYQKRAGNDVVVISDNDHLKYAQNPALTKKIISRGTDYEQDGIKICKIKTFFNTSSTSFLCIGLYEILEREKPDMIFHHNLIPSTLLIAARYKKHHPNVKLYADNHVDWINESKNRLWHLFYYDFLMPLQLKRIEKYVDAFIGVSPLRCKYLSKVFKVPEEKVQFLPIGCDTYQAEQVKESKDELRAKFGLPVESFVIVSGGKLDRSKGTLTLIEACEILKVTINNLHLVLFGKIDEELKQIAKEKEWITMEGWCDRKKTLSILKMADAACWPCLHTTLIEDSIASGIPLVVKMSDNVSHLAKEQAGVFLVKGNVDELIKAFLDVKNNATLYHCNAINARDKYSYTNLVGLLDKKLFCEL